MKTSVVTFLSIVTLLAGCNNGDSGSSHKSSKPAPLEQTSGMETTNHQGVDEWPSDVPKITDPIDLDSWSDNPCDILTNEQLGNLTINSNPKPGHTKAGPNCTWGDLTDDGINIGGSLGVSITSTIPGLYKNNNLGKYAYFDPITINDYPAVFFGRADDRNHGGCGIAIALEPSHTYVINLRLHEDYPRYNKPCSVLEDVSTMAVDTMTQGNS